MSTGTKNKLLTWLVVLLLVANTATIAFFWLNRGKRPAEPKGSPREFLSKELNFDAKQQEQLKELVAEHRAAAEKIRPEIRKAKEAFFELIKQPGISDSTRLAAAKAVSSQTEALDLLTFDHFKKIRSICTPGQQQQFDNIVQDVIRMLGQPRPGNGMHRPPPPGEGPPGNPPPPPGE